MIYLIAINALLQVLDVITTNGALANGAREANPIVKAMMDRFGRAWWVPKIIGAGLLLYAAWLHSSPLTTIALGILAVWYSKVVLGNYLLWRR